MTTVDYKEVGNYYNASIPIYKLFAYNNTTLSIHYGFWYKNTKSLEEAMENEIQNIIDCANIKEGQLVLDAGCGVGGSSIYIANKTKARVTGISISSQQILEAQKSAFLKEAFRILKPHGCLVISDGYKKGEPKDVRSKKIIEDFVYGYALSELVTPREMTSEIEKAGFNIISVDSKLEEIGPSVRYFHNLSKLFIYPAMILRYLHPVFLVMYRNMLAAIKSYEGMKLGIADYCVHVAQKPNP